MEGSVAESIDALRLTISTLEAQRGVLGDEAVELALGPVRARLTALDGGSPDQLRTPEVVAERKVVTVVFADISGFTAMSEQLDSETVHAVMNSVFDRLVPVIERYGGSIDKFIGDEIMALFGAPRATQHHAEHALRACLGLFEALAEFNHEHQTSLGLHAGVNSGLVVAGDVGSLTRRDYSVMGDVVNVAARLEGASETGEILVGSATYRQTLGTFEFEVLEPLVLKGKRDAVPVFRLIGLREHRQSALDGDLELDFVGRTPELGALERSVAGSARGICLVGAPGLGKSRLTAELRSVIEVNGIGWLAAHALEYRSSVSHGVIHDLIDAVIGAPPNADLHKVSSILDDYVGERTSPGAQVVLPYLRHLRGLGHRSPEDELPAGLTPTVVRARMVGELRWLLHLATQAQPTVLLVEDIHWSDPSSLIVLRELLFAGLGDEITVVMTSRPDSSGSAWIEQVTNADDRVTVVELGPLGDDDVDRLLSEVLVTADRSDELRRRVRERADGNPFFLVSFLRSLIDDGVASLDDGVVTVNAPVDELRVPENLLAAVGARIDGVAPEARSVLRLASVLGRTFDPAFLDRLASRASSVASAEVTAAVEELVRRQLLEHRSDRQVQFVHAVVQSVAYEGMLLRARRQLHAHAADLLEADIGEQSSESIVAAVARHHLLAGHASEASRWFERAAEMAASAYANEEAAAHLAAAMDAADGDPERRLRLADRRVDLLQLSGRFADAADVIGTIDDGGDPRIRARLGRKLARTQVPRQLTDDAVATLYRSSDVLASIPEAARDDRWRREFFAVENELLWVLYMRGDVGPLRARVAMVQPELSVWGEPIERGSFSRTLALMELRESRFRVGPEVVERAAVAVAQLRECDDLPALSFASFTHAFTLLWSGRIEEAHVGLLDVLELAQRIGDAERSLLSLNYLAVASRLRCDVLATEAFALAAASLAERNGAKLYQGFALGNLAWVRWSSGADADVVLGALDDAADLMAVIPGFPFGWVTDLVRVRIDLSRRRLESALAACDRMAAPTQQLLREPVQAALDAAVAQRTRSALERFDALCGTHGYL